MDPIKKTIRSYEEKGEDYTDRTSEGGNREFQEKMMDKTLKILNTNKPRIIDLGCGDGRDTAYFREKGLDVTGIDLSNEMISIARKKYPDNTFLQMDMRDTIFPDDTFNCAWASASIIHFPKKELSHVEKEVYRILEPEGIFAFSFKVGEGEGYEKTETMEDNERYFSYYTLEDIKKALNLFDIVESKECPSNIFGNEFIYCWARPRRK